MKNSMEMVAFTLSMVEGAGKSWEDNKLTYFDSVNFFDALQKAGPAFEDASLIPGEMASMDEASKQQMFAMVAALDIPQDEAEAYVEKAMQASILFSQLVFSLIAARKAKMVKA